MRMYGKNLNLNQDSFALLSPLPTLNEIYLVLYQNELTAHLSYGSLKDRYTHNLDLHR